MDHGKSGPGNEAVKKENGLDAPREESPSKTTLRVRLRNPAIAPSRPDQDPLHQAGLTAQDPSMPVTRRSGRSSQAEADTQAQEADSGGRGMRRRSTKTLNYAEPPEDSEDHHEYIPNGSEVPENGDGDGDGEDADAPEEEAAEGEDESEDEVMPTNRTTRFGRKTSAPKYALDSTSDDEEKVERKRRLRRGVSSTMADFVADDDEVDGEAEFGSSPKKAPARTRHQAKLQGLAKRKAQKTRSTRASSAKRDQDDDFVEPQSEGDAESSDAGEIGSLEEENQSDEPEGSQGKSYSFRQRKKVNYSLIPPPPEPARDGFGRVIRKSGSKGSGGVSAYELDDLGEKAGPSKLPGMPLGFEGRGKKGKEGWDALPLSMTGKDYAKAFGDPVDSSDDDLPNSVKKPGGPALFGGSAAGGMLGAGGLAPAGGPEVGGLSASGATDSMGRIKKGGDPLADVDPLGVDMNIGFDSVGGLDHHIQQLKEMVTLPLLYPELFQRFKVTPPRGVLFHGPPGTGKTLVARALASSCSSEGQQISFFMRKGADCLSKWVGEAERQLRLLFEEARNSQPSIIFFDEIDGLAPVRSSKQDQIHASIVSTLLALMDGMEGRGQVVVIGATNRPDSVDPALRRPGRFDREFYFPLPSKEARLSIINIQTRKWEPPLDEEFKLRLAEVTKGYGGADLRALCTEAALNAIQRRYPQIYSTTDRLLLDPESILVDAKDFMMSVNKIVPSSARSTSSAAAPLPDRLKPLLQHAVDRATAALDKVLPSNAKRNPLEEALWEDDVDTPGKDGVNAGSDRGFGREMLLQSFEAQRVFRPRMLIHGGFGMGQPAVGAALLQHLEGYHVQTLDIGSLMGDSSRTPEAAVVQLFIEAKRHKPSVVFIPGLVHWSQSVSESVKTTVKALLDGLAPSDPVLLLGIAEAPLSELPREVRSWFGYLRDNRVEIQPPNLEQRERYFSEILANVTRPPTEFPDALPRKRRVLEELPKAPPRPPRQPTQAELQQQADNDARLLEHLKYRLGPVLAELRKKFKKFTRDVWDEYNLHDLTQRFDSRREKGKIIVTIRYDRQVHAEHHRRESSADELINRAASNEAKEAGEAAAYNVPSLPQNGHATEARVEGPGSPSAGPSLCQDPASLALPSERQQEPFVQEGLEEVEMPEPSQQQSSVKAAEAGPDPNSDRSKNPEAETSNAEDNSPYILRDLVIWTMTLEKMQKRLYYNGYLTCSAFMEDIAKIVSNAEAAAEVDSDRVFRAHQMRNLANVLMDQYVDVNFRAECERMALRQSAREAEAREAAETAKAAATAARAPSGERQSARIQGMEPELKSPVDVGAIERNSKRSRQSSSRNPSVEREANDMDLGDESESRKRARTDAEENVDGDGSTASAANGTQEPLERDLTNGSGGPGQGVAGDQISSGVEVAAGSSPVGKAHAAHPPFKVDQGAVGSLGAYLLSKTSCFSIEQLEQLRAACFDRVWSRRSDWDRSQLIKELRELTDEVASAVLEENSTEESGMADGY
ncbi:AAA-domain-containing protein [Violaceomyces palustris]|uniref:AAA-domain-containing protein n=1 Tax=Violaceomyces palustris TaxID=1673888 RepID=A0ACD0P913_9BASI|nr:AAA-domain-containing protein [Violaceomyces palustris]